jgi:serine/threonine-protein kinase
MASGALRPETPSWVTDRSESAGEVALLQHRLALLGAISAALTLGFYLVAQVMVQLGPENPWPAAAHGLTLTTLLLTGGAWLYCRGRRRPATRLRTLEGLLMMAMGFLVLFTSPEVIPEPELRTMVMLLSVTLVLYTRSIFIPSSPVRTLVLSAATALPLAVYALATESPRLGIWKVMWLLAAITVATAGSAVIYGLRREVRAARQLGQYTLEEKLGEGGMGVVYLARHAMLRRPTAVKLVKSERVRESTLRRFEREVQLTAGLSHPNTVSVFDYGRTPDGVFYYAMEYLEGLTLDELVDADGPQTPGRTVHILRQVLGALAEAHGIGLVHRDIKPGNIILCERGGLSDVAKVLDFGLVKDLETPGGMTQDGTLVGTPLYLAPEAIRSPNVDARADLYSLGAVAYFLLTGHHVFDGRTVVEICSHHLHTPPTPPSSRLGHDLPPDLDAWVLACLEKDPSGRPGSASAASARLDRCAITEEWTLEAGRAWWAAKGRALATTRRTDASPSAATLSRPVLRRAL